MIKGHALNKYAYDWSATRADSTEAWIFHVLRREAEATVLPNLPALPGGNHQPQDKDERLALPAARLATCEFQGLHGAAARLYSDAFDAEPKLTEAVPKGTRYYAARTAARAA